MSSRRFIPLLLGMVLTLGSSHLVYAFYCRIRLILKTYILVKRIGSPEWKAWFLSAVEPLVTTIVTIVWVNNVRGFADESTYLVAQLSILLFAGLIWWVGRTHQRGRFAITILLTRFAMLGAGLYILAFLKMNGPYGQFDSDRMFTVYPAVLMFLRSVFGIYQNHVTPTWSQHEQMQTEEQIHIAQRMIENDVMLIDDPALWDEQMALIEQLKAEEEMIAIPATQN